MNIILFDTPERKKFFPLTLNKAIADLRVGILTIKERWEKITGAKVFILSEPYLSSVYQSIELEESFVLVDARIVITAEVLNRLQALDLGSALFDQKGLVMGSFNNTKLCFSMDYKLLFDKIVEVENCRRIEYAFEIFLLNDEFLRSDFTMLTRSKASEDNLLKNNVLIDETNIFLEEGARVSHSILNASTGPIYIGKNSTIMEGCTVRGPFALGERATLKMGTKVYGATTLGPYCVGGGEIKNAVLMGYSNKAHEGYLGDSVIGEWCNLGAGTSNSNVKNSAGQVKTWDYYSNENILVGLKCGVLMGDFSRTAINTSINTGSSIGLSCNIFGGGLTPKVISSFTWGIKEKSEYPFHKAIEDIANWKNFKGKELSVEEVEVLKYIFENFKD